MIIKMKLFAVFCLAFVLSACGSTTLTREAALEALEARRIAYEAERPAREAAAEAARIAYEAERPAREAAAAEAEARRIAYEAERQAREAAAAAAEAARIAQGQVVTLSELFQNFEDNHLRADANYSNKPVRVTGVLRNFESFLGEYYFVEIGGAGVIESFRDRSLIILLGRLSPLTTSTYPGRYDSEGNWINKADEIKESLINLTIGETYTFYCESPSKQLLSDTMNRIYEVEQERTARPITRWLREKQGLAEQNRAYLCTKGEVIQ
jgi:hypothetical protein